MAQYEIDNYKIFHMENNFGQSTIVHCLFGNDMKGAMYFYKEGVNIPKSYKADNGFIGLNYPEKHAPAILETLRREKPLYIWFNEAFEFGGLKTTSEPVGEEEPSGI